MSPLRGLGLRQRHETPGLRPGLDDFGATRLEMKIFTMWRLERWTYERSSSGMSKFVQTFCTSSWSSSISTSFIACFAWFSSTLT